MKLAVVLLARIVVGEAGFSATEDDVVAHFEAIQNLADRKGWSFAKAAHARSGRNTGAKPSLQRHWVPRLTYECKKPARWDETERLPWSMYKERCKRIMALSKAAHTGELVRRCEGSPTHWASPKHSIDLRRMRSGLAAGRWSIVSCGNTRNIFLEWHR